MAAQPKRALITSHPALFTWANGTRPPGVPSALVNMLAECTVHRSFQDPPCQILPGLALLISIYYGDRWDPTWVLSLDWAHLRQPDLVLHFFAFQILSVTPWQLIVSELKVSLRVFCVLANPLPGSCCCCSSASPRLLAETLGKWRRTSVFTSHA